MAGLAANVLLLLSFARDPEGLGVVCELCSCRCYWKHGFRAVQSSLSEILLALFVSFNSRSSGSCFSLASTQHTHAGHHNSFPHTHTEDDAEGRKSALADEFFASSLLLLRNLRGLSMGPPPSR